MAPDGLEDPVASAAGMEAILASGLADTDRVFRQFLALCEAAGPDRCAPGRPWRASGGTGRTAAGAAAPGPAASPLRRSAWRIDLRRDLDHLKLATLPEPSIWPFAAAALEEAVQGDGSTIETAAQVTTSDEFAWRPRSRVWR
jgi:hypothetical protein